MQASDLREKAVPELKDELHGLLKEQFSLRMQIGSGQLPRHRQIREVRRNIARVKTILHEKTKAAI